MMTTFRVLTPVSGHIETIFCVHEATENDVRLSLIRNENYPPDVVVKKITRAP